MEEDQILDDGGDTGNDAGGYDPETMGEVLTADEYRNSPAWFRERMGHMARTKNEAKQEATSLRSEIEALRSEFGEIRSRLSNPAPKADEPEKPFVKKATEEQLKSAATRIMGLQELARDPDASPEERAEAKKQLSGLGDAPSVLFDIQQEIADRRAAMAAGALREEFQGKSDADQARSALVNRLFTSYGADAINKESPLAKAAFGKLKTWATEYGITADQVSDFMTIKAFEEAASELRTKTPGRRGADPRQSAVMGTNGSARQDHGDIIEALERKGQKGDWKASRKASELKLNKWLDANGFRQD